MLNSRKIRNIFPAAIDARYVPDLFIAECSVPVCIKTGIKNELTEIRVREICFADLNVCQSKCSTANQCKQQKGKANPFRVAYSEASF